jgi:hypothetical protein
MMTVGSAINFTWYTTEEVTGGHFFCIAHDKAH